MKMNDFPAVNINGIGNVMLADLRASARVSTQMSDRAAIPT